MTAKEMFEKLGFELAKDFDFNYIYTGNERKDDLRLVYFDLNYKTYSTHATDEFGDTVYMGVTPELHLAITQQMKELGWIE